MLLSNYGSLLRGIRRIAPSALGVVALIAGFSALQFGLAPKSDAIAAAPQTTVPARSAENTANRGAERSEIQPTTTAVPVTTAAPSTTLAPTTTTPKPIQAATSGNVQSGQASYYDHKPGGCAHKTLPKGTVVTVTNVSNNKSTTCVVNDRGPFVAGRIIDLETRVFKQVASTSAGVFNARISW